MKLMYDLPEADSAALAAVSAGEKLMYCVPFNMYEDRFVKGFTAVTDKHIYCILDGKILKTVELSTEQNYNMIDGLLNNAPALPPQPPEKELDKVKEPPNKHRSREREER